MGICVDRGQGAAGHGGLGHVTLMLIPHVYGPSDKPGTGWMGPGHSDTTICDKT